MKYKFEAWLLWFPRNKNISWFRGFGDAWQAPIFNAHDEAANALLASPEKRRIKIRRVRVTVEVI